MIGLSSTRRMVYRTRPRYERPIGMTGRDAMLQPCRQTKNLKKHWRFGVVCPVLYHHYSMLTTMCRHRILNWVTIIEFIV